MANFACKKKVTKNVISEIDKEEIIILISGKDSSLLNPLLASQKIKPILAPKKIIKTIKVEIELLFLEADINITQN